MLSHGFLIWHRRLYIFGAHGTLTRWARDYVATTARRIPRGDWGVAKW